MNDLTNQAMELARSALREQAERIRELEEAMQEAERRLFGAWQMLEAICESDFSRDRRAAADKALAGLNSVRSILNKEKK